MPPSEASKLGDTTVFTYLGYQLEHMLCKVSALIYFHIYYENRL